MHRPNKLVSAIMPMQNLAWANYGCSSGECRRPGIGVQSPARELAGLRMTSSMIGLISCPDVPRRLQISIKPEVNLIREVAQDQ
jgi:hypothetical protein